MMILNMHLKKLFIFSYLIMQFSLQCFLIAQNEQTILPEKEKIFLKFHPPKGNSFESSHDLDFQIHIPNFIKALDGGEPEMVQGTFAARANIEQKIEELNDKLLLTNTIKSFDVKIDFPQVYLLDISKQNSENSKELHEMILATEKLTYEFNPTGHLIGIKGLEQFSEATSLITMLNFHKEGFQEINDLFTYPEYPISVGDHWGIDKTDKIGESNGVSSTVKRQSMITFAKLENTTAMLDEKIFLEFNFLLPKPNISPFDTLIFTITGNGTSLVDLKTGWTLKREMHIESQTKGKMAEVEIPLPISAVGTFNLKSSSVPNVVQNLDLGNVRYISQKLSEVEKTK